MGCGMQSFFMKKKCGNKKITLINYTFAIGLIILLIGLIKGYQAPTDYLQGDLIKIMYIHVPLAWVSLILYAVAAACAIVYLVKRVIIFDILTCVISNVTLWSIGLTLITGSIWGKPAWGTWWAWDARLTAMLLLFCLNFCYVLVRSLYKDTELASKISAIFAIIGLLNLPIIKFSVDVWSTLHQKSTFFNLQGAPKIHPSMMYPNFIIFFGLLLMLCAFVAIQLEVFLARKKLLRASLKELF